MFGWFNQRKRGASEQASGLPPDWAESVPAVVVPPGRTGASPPAAQQLPALPDDDLAMTVPAALRDLAETMPAALDALGGSAAEAGTHSAFSWMLGAAEPVPTLELSPGEAELLRRLDALLDAPALPPNLLPRMPAVIPQLMGLLRREQTSRAELAQQVARDVLLTAEVLRVARSSTYGARPVERLEDALDRIGGFGLQSAMARVLMKPVFQAGAGGLSARAAGRLWLYAESKSMYCAELVAGEGDRFEGFLAGLMHDTGWLALLRLLDRLGLRPALPISSVLDAELDRRKDRLFGRLTADWGLTPGITALSLQLADGQAQVPGSDTLVRSLRTADRLCLAHVGGA